jgi:DNA invertase Pin-like site-specific DNA recombinase
MLRQMLAVAELEAGMISERANKALAEAKKRGTKLGGDRGYRITSEASAAGRKIKSQRSERRARDLQPIIEELRANGSTSLHALRKALTARGIPTARGRSTSSPMQVARVLSRLAG